MNNFTQKFKLLETKTDKKENNTDAVEKDTADVFFDDNHVIIVTKEKSIRKVDNETFPS